jgi:hypothetical protein
MRQIGEAVRQAGAGRRLQDDRLARSRAGHPDQRQPHLRPSHPWTLETGVQAITAAALDALGAHEAP